MPGAGLNDTCRCADAVQPVWHTACIYVVMSQDMCYLRRDVMLEPLVDGWYAWAHLIPPATAARNLTERHLRIMDSYLENPSAHAAAIANPALLGGPFMDFSGGRVDQVKRLRDHTVEHNAAALELSRAIAELDQLLREKADGASLEPLYEEVPGVLKGYVELVYDLNHQPSFRLLEPLLYHSRFYDDARQSVAVSLIDKDDRPFVLSTPRLGHEHGLELQFPFNSRELEALYQMRSFPGSFAHICRLLHLDERKSALLATFMTPEPPPAYQSYRGEGARWRYFGHACILLETATVSVLLDPVLSYTFESDISRYTYDDLPPTIDYVLITHNHQDHILFETLLQLRHRIGTIVVPRSGGGALQDPSLRLILKACGFERVIEVDEMDVLPFADGSNGSIQSLPFFGEHGDLNVHTKAAWLVRMGEHSFLFAADSCNVSPELYEHVHAITGDVEVLFVGMECDGAPMSWIYGPLLTVKMDRKKDRSRRLAGSNYERARDMVERFGCKDVYVYAMGQEPWLNYVMSIKYSDESRPIVDSNRLLALCRERGITAERLFGEREILLPATGARKSGEAGGAQSADLTAVGAGRA